MHKIEADLDLIREFFAVGGLFDGKRHIWIETLVECVSLISKVQSGVPSSSRLTITGEESTRLHELVRFFFSDGNGEEEESVQTVTALFSALRLDKICEQPDYD